MPSVAVVILNWNGRYFLEKFLPSVYNSTYTNVQFVLGDNGSDDDSVDFVKQQYPLFKIVENDQNYGFAEGYNRVLKAIEADYYVLLNSDVEVMPGWIEPVIALLESNPGMAAAQPKIRSFHERDKFEHAGAAGGYLDRYGFPFCRGRILDHTEVDTGQYDDATSIFWATGAAFFIKRSCWEQTGGFDGDFFAHMEEIDLCWRLKRLGYSIGYCPDATVYHVGGGTLATSNPQKTYLNFRNNLMMIQKNHSFLMATWTIALRLWIDLFALIHFLFKGNPQDAAAVSRAHRRFFSMFFKTVKKRKALRDIEKQIGSRKVDQNGYYKGSIIWAYYVGGKRTFRALMGMD